MIPRPHNSYMLIYFQFIFGCIFLNYVTFIKEQHVVNTNYTNIYINRNKSIQKILICLFLK